MNKINERVTKSIKECGIATRPNATPGLWLMPLLPTAIIVSAIKHPKEISQIYQISVTISIGLLLTSFVFIIQCIRRKEILKMRSLYLLPGAVVATILNVVFQRDYVASFISGFVGGIGYYKLFITILKKLPFSFTIGEASVVVQAFVLFMHSLIENLLVCAQYVPYKMIDISTLIIQMGLLTIGIIGYLSYGFPSLRRPTSFYTMSFFTILFILIIPLHILLRQSPLVFIFALLFKQINTINVVLYWAVCTIIAIIAVSRQIIGAKKASTIVRKTFHILAVAVYLPGLMYECSLLYVASGVIFGLFLFLELLRILNMPPLGQRLQDGFIVFCDEKDVGIVALTPLYLLVGCSMPIWVHPAPCDLTDSAGFYLLPLISGLISIGVGDTAASVIGSLIGRHKWPGSNKTVEGTLSCVLSQVILVFLLVYLGIIYKGHLQIIKSGIAIVVTSLIEAKTSQVDNLALPLITYIILV